MDEQFVKLKSITDGIETKQLYLCIEDLVKNGVDLARFSETEPKPARQDVTQYLAAWFKYIGMSESQCLNWILEHYMDELLRISQSSRSRIRHSTKSNVKYIFNSKVNFNCGCEKNIFKASCTRDCVLYEEMQEIERNKKIAKEAEFIAYSANNAVIAERKLTKREKYLAQFNEAMEIAEKCLKEEGMTKVQVVSLLNERGYKTKTGKAISYSVFTNEWTIYKNK